MAKTAKKSEKIIKSLYAGDVTREQRKPRFCETVGDLKRVLANYPDDLPLGEELSLSDVEDGCTPGAALIWFNIGQSDEHLMIEPNDGTWEEPIT